MPAKTRIDPEITPSEPDAGSPPEQLPELVWIANQEIRIDSPRITYAANEPCLNAPVGWPPQWLIDQGLVRKQTTTEGL